MLKSRGQYTIYGAVVFSLTVVTLLISLFAVVQSYPKVSYRQNIFIRCGHLVKGSCIRVNKGDYAIQLGERMVLNGEIVSGVISVSKNGTLCCDLCAVVSELGKKVIIRGEDILCEEESS